MNLYFHVKRRCRVESDPANRDEDTGSERGYRSVNAARGVNVTPLATLSAVLGTISHILSFLDFLFSGISERFLMTAPDSCQVILKQCTGAQSFKQTGK